MLIDAPTPGQLVDLSAQYVIVGAGAVGLALAILLGRSGYRVLVVETGARQVPLNYKSLNAGASTGKPHRGLTEGRLKAYGGTTRLWGGQLVPFGRADIESAPDSRTPAWPISYEELQTAYSHAFDLLGIPPDQRDENRIWLEANGECPELGTKLRLGMNIWLKQPDFTKLFGDEVERSTQITVALNTSVARVTFSGTPDVARSIVCKAETSEFEINTPTLILACGTLEITRLLLETVRTQSNCGFRDNKNIGKYFIDHIHGLAGRIIVRDKIALSRYFDNIYSKGTKYGIKIRAIDGFRQEASISNCAATIHSSVEIGTLVRDLYSLARRSLSSKGGGSLRAVVENTTGVITAIVPLAWRYLVERRSSRLFSGEIFLGLELEQLPTENSYLFLQSSAEGAESTIGIHWGFSGEEMHAAAVFCEEINSEFERRGLGSVIIDERIKSRDTSFLDDCHDSNHHMGGTRMANHESSGVVDCNLKVFSTKNLYVLGAAVFPSGSFANPTLTAIALATRLAKQLSTSC